MRRSLRTASVTAGFLVLLSLTACGSDDEAEGAGGNGSSCERQASAAACAAAATFATELEGLAGVESVEVGFETVEGEGVSEIDVSLATTQDSTTEQVAAAIAFALEEAVEVDPGRDLELAVSRGGAVVHLDPDHSPEVQDSAELLVAAGDLGEHGAVEVATDPAKIDVRLPEGTTADDVTRVAGEVVAAGLPPSVGVAVIGDDGSYLSQKDGIRAEDVDRWRRLADGLRLVDGFEVWSMSLSGDDVAVEVAFPEDVRADELTVEAWGDRLLPMVHAHLDVVGELPDGAEYAIDTNWPEGDDGWDYFLVAYVGPKADGDRDVRGWDAAAEQYLDGR